MTNTRRAELSVTYNGVDISTDLAAAMTEFTYTDAAPGQLDDVQISMEDRDGRWIDSWSPTEGDYLDAAITVYNWSKPGESAQLPCGRFYVDSVICSGGSNGNVVTIQAVSLPLNSSARQERKSKSWENVSLWKIAQEIAAGAGLGLQFYADDNPNYERQDQTEQSDIGFLLDSAANEGIAAKISGDQLILFEEAFYEQQEPAFTLTRGEDSILSFSFSWNATNAAYRACEVTYTIPNEDKTITATYTPPGASETGPVLKIKESVESEAEALRKARIRLRERNKQFGRASVSVMGDIRMAAGLPISISGWGRFDGEYLIESAAHKIGNGGYTTDIEIRKVLGW